jgi:hypothetical protein
MGWGGSKREERRRISWRIIAVTPRIKKMRGSRGSASKSPEPNVLEAALCNHGDVLIGNI